MAPGWCTWSLKGAGTVQTDPKATVRSEAKALMRSKGRAMVDADQMWVLWLPQVLVLPLARDPQLGCTGG